VQTLYAFLLRAIRTAEYDASLAFYSVPHNSTAAVVASRRQRMNRAFKAIEDMPSTGNRYLKRLVVLIAANFAGTHEVTSQR
jgi:hypothetical protein